MSPGQMGRIEGEVPRLGPDPSESGIVERTATVRLRALLTAADSLLAAGLIGEARRLVGEALRCLAATEGPRESASGS